MSVNAVNIKELVDSGSSFEVTPATFEEIEKDLRNEDGVEITDEEFDKELSKHVNYQCIGDFEDENTYDSSEPFAVLATKMTDLIKGHLKKRVLREGYGNYPEENCIARIHYNSYTEFSETPFDCTYARKKPMSVTIGKTSIIPGLHYAIQTMKINELSQFLIGPELAYGEMGVFERILPKSTILIQVELLEVIESGAALCFENLPPEEKTEFKQAYKYSMAQLAKGKDLFKRTVPAAVKAFNLAINALDNAQMMVHEEQIQQQELLFKLLSNLLVCHTKMEEPKKGCTSFNRMKDMCKGTDLKMPAKAYFNNARCLRMLGDYKMAKSRLQMARNLEPRNPDILNEFKIIDDAQKRDNDKEKQMATAWMKAVGT
ncbi:unnamed protein product [Ceutorhynchus assimilis]|uniref:peptidylprolyl isomerase n=1 Tax=Ceutorhynchus assimilis TaxID=467358 RepID=A0A9N9QLT9_9CUCU|nr:unnamed protein product [Ceutorhynchus assimilis]